MDFLSSLSLLSPRTCLIFFGGVSIVWYLRGVAAQRKRNPRRLPLPPGPKGLPIVGNTLQIPTVKPWKEYDTMAREYGTPFLYLTDTPHRSLTSGGLVYLDVLGQGILILGSLPRALELMEKRAASTSNRPPIPALELSVPNMSTMPM